MEQETLRDIPFIRDIVKVAEEEAAERARQEEITRLRELLLILVKTRFSPLLTRSRTQASHMNTPEVLKDVLEKLMLATTLEEAQQVFQDQTAALEKAKKSRGRKKKS